MSWGDHGCPIAWTPEIAECVELYGKLKQFPRCASGGPLHIITDDDNLEDHWLRPKSDRYNRREFRRPQGWVVLDEIEWPQEVIDICERILELLRGMGEAERYAVNAYHWGDAQEYIEKMNREKPWNSLPDWRAGFSAR